MTHASHSLLCVLLALVIVGSTGCPNDGQAEVWIVNSLDEDANVYFNAAIENPGGNPIEVPAYTLRVARISRLHLSEVSGQVETLSTVLNVNFADSELAFLNVEAGDRRGMNIVPTGAGTATVTELALLTDSKDRPAPTAP